MRMILTFLIFIARFHQPYLQRKFLKAGQSKRQLLNKTPHTETILRWQKGLADTDENTSWQIKD